MNVHAIIEKMSLDLMIKNRIDRSTLNALLLKISTFTFDDVAQQWLKAFSATLDEDTPNSVKTALAALEGLTLHLSATTSKNTHNFMEQITPTLSEELSYDTSYSQEILDSFISEVGTHLQSVEENLLHLEKCPSDKDALNAVFRAMHSLKGITGFLSVSAAHELAHVAESLMERARVRESGITSNECDIILKTVDSLREMQSLILTHSLDKSLPFPSLPVSYTAIFEVLHQAVESISSASLIPVTEIDDDAVPTRATENAGPAIFAAPEAPHFSLEPRLSGRTEHSGLVRVKTEKLDNLIDAVGEIVVTLTQVQHDPDLNVRQSSKLSRNMSQLTKIARQLQSVAMSLRMFPLRDTFGRMTRTARDLAHKQAKSIDIVIEGEETELDRNVIEVLIDPLTHLVRNAVDHGVDSSEERIANGKPPSARITFLAKHEGSKVVVEVTDDGRGLDLERIEKKARGRGILGANDKPSAERLHAMIFEPGFSTTEHITSISGRGVGLDVVKRHVETLGGRVSVASVPGHSTTFTLALPLTLSIIDGLIVKVGEERYVIPIANVIESIRPDHSQCSTVYGRGELIEVRGSMLPMIRLSSYTKTEASIVEPWKAIVMIVECRGERFGLMVDELIGQQQVVIKSLGERLRGIKGICGGAVLGDGRVGLILDVVEIMSVSRQSAVLA